MVRWYAVGAQTDRYVYIKAEGKDFVALVQFNASAVLKTRASDLVDQTSGRVPSRWPLPRDQWPQDRPRVTPRRNETQSGLQQSGIPMGGGSICANADG